MSKDFRNSETKDNLMRAFAGESQARNRYTFAASQARKDGLHVIEAVFTFTANQEKEHAEIFYNHLKELSGETIVVDGGYPVDIYPDVKQLLLSAQHNEYEEYDPIYKVFGDKAKEEGFDKVAASFHMISAIEKLMVIVLVNSPSLWSRTSSSFRMWKPDGSASTAGMSIPVPTHPKNVLFVIMTKDILSVCPCLLFQSKIIAGKNELFFFPAF